MHPFELSDELKARMTAKQGRAHTIDRLDPARTALVVVDMQNYYMAPGQQSETPEAREIVPNINRLADALRTAGGTVVWIENLAPLGDDFWPSYAERCTPERWENRTRSLTPGDVGYALWPDLDMRAQDLRVVKKRFSAFTDGASDLDARLRRAGIDTILVTGVATNVCCESTARDAMMLDYHVAMVSDGCAGFSDAQHAATLTNFYLFFGDVRTTDELCTLL